MRIFLRSRQLLIALGILVLVAATILGAYSTRQTQQDVASIKTKSKTEAGPLVDESPLIGARSVAKLADTADEDSIANSAVESADDEVDLAFRDASRDAADHPTQNDPRFKEQFKHSAEVATQTQEDQNQVAALKKQLASAPIAKQDAIQEQLDVAQAQLELDQDELTDAREDLIRAGADPGSLIQRQFKEHQDTEHSENDKTKKITHRDGDVDYSTGSLYAQIKNWRALNWRADQIAEVSEKSQQKAAALNAQHDALEKQLSAAKPRQKAAANDAMQASAAQQGSAQASGAAVQSLHLLSDSQKNLADLDQRIQDETAMRGSYESWIGLIKTYQRATIHGMFQNLLWILLIVFASYVTNHLISVYLVDSGAEHTRLRTLRAVVRFALQAVVLLLVLLVIFGAPNQMPTVLGLAGAGLTVAMKDFIVAFFGWFVLMGRNGLRVGDWVEINGVAGEVVEVNLLRTVVMETGNWTDTGHPTGRKVSFVNSFAIEGHFFNFSTSGQWMWDEIEIVVPPSENPYPLMETIQEAVLAETAKSSKEAEQEWARATTRYKVQSVSAAPAVNLRPSGSGIEVRVRYVTRASERYATRTRLYQALVHLLHGEPKEKNEKALSSAK